MAACASADPDADADADSDADLVGADGGGEEAPLRARASALRHLVARDPLAADATLTLFASAVFSHRYASVARPLPKGCASIHRLTAALDAAPALRSLLGGGRAARMAPPSTLALLLWLLTPPPRPHAHAHAHAPRAVLRALPRTKHHAPTPSYLFEVENPTLDAKWRALAQGKRTLLVFLGQPLDAFHSVVNLGLRSLGDQVVLRRSLARALQDSSPGYGLGSSELGARLQCVAEVEVALSPGGVALSPSTTPSEEEEQKDVVVRDGRLGRVARLLLFKAAPPLPPPLPHEHPAPATAPAVRARPLRGFGDANTTTRLPEFRFEVETGPQLTCKEGIDFWTSFPGTQSKKDLPCNPSCECANKPVMRKAHSFPVDKTRNYSKQLSPELEKRLQSMALDKYEDFDEDWESFLRSLNEADGTSAAHSSEAAPPPPPPPATPPRPPSAHAHQTPPQHKSPDASHRFSAMSSTANTTEDLLADDTLSSTRTQDSTESSRREDPSSEADSASGARDQPDDLPPMPHHGLIRRPPPLKLEPRKPRWDHLPITQYSPSRYQVRTDYSSDTDESLPLSAEEQPRSEEPVATPEDAPAQAAEPQATTSAEPDTSATGSKRMPKCKTVPSKRKSSKDALKEDDNDTAEASKSRFPQEDAVATVATSEPQGQRRPRPLALAIARPRTATAPASTPAGLPLPRPRTSTRAQRPSTCSATW